MKLDFDDDARARYTHAPSTSTAAAIQAPGAAQRRRYVGISTSQSLEDVIFGDLVRVRGIA